jgi:phage shock protein PspC (stress-responsive transcriptional regulator)
MDENEESTSETATKTDAPEIVKPLRVGLRRSATRRMFAGVAGGLGERFDIDANIVRVIFVVSCALWGLGLAIYLAMWVLIPLAPIDPNEPIEDEKVPPMSRRHWLRYALLAGVIIVAVSITTSVSGNLQFGKSLALVWLVFLVVLAVITLRTPARRINIQRLVALLFLMALSFVILVSGVVLGVLSSTGVPIQGGSGQRAWQPTALAQVQPSYRLAFGKSTLDLTHVKFPERGFKVVASVGVGYLVIDVPVNAIVELKSHVGLGTAVYPTGNGYSTENFVAVPPSLVSVASQKRAPHLTLNAQVGFGRLDIVRVTNGP